MLEGVKANTQNYQITKAIKYIKKLKKNKASTIVLWSTRLFEADALPVLKLCFSHPSFLPQSGIWRERELQPFSITVQFSTFPPNN